MYETDAHDANGLFLIMSYQNIMCVKKYCRNETNTHVFILLQISDQVRMDLRFCREWHSRQRFFVACFCCVVVDENLKFTPKKPSNRAPISRFSYLIGNL
jgi:hypothetical protein